MWDLYRPVCLHSPTPGRSHPADNKDGDCNKERHLRIALNLWCGGVDREASAEADERKLAGHARAQEYRPCRMSGSKPSGRPIAGIKPSPHRNLMQTETIG